MFNVIEQPWLLLTIAVVVFLIQRILRSINPVKYSNVYLLVPLAIAGSAFLVDYLFETDQEKLNSLVKVLKRAVVNEDEIAFEQRMSPDYSDDYHRNRQMAIRHLRRLFEIAPVKAALVGEKNLSMEADTATIKMKIGMMFEDHAPISSATVSFSVFARKNPDGKWLITSTELHELNKQPVSWGQLP